MSRNIKVSDELYAELEAAKERVGEKTITKTIGRLLAKEPNTLNVPDWRKQVGRFELVELVGQHDFPELPLSSGSIPLLVDGWRESVKSLPDEEIEKEYSRFFASGRIYDQYEEMDAVLTSRWVISRNRICVIEYSTRVPIINLTDYVLDRLVELGELV